MNAAEGNGTPDLEAAFDSLRGVIEQQPGSSLAVIAKSFADGGVNAISLDRAIVIQSFFTLLARYPLWGSDAGDDQVRAEMERIWRWAQIAGEVARGEDVAD